MLIIIILEHEEVAFTWVYWSKTLLCDKSVATSALMALEEMMLGRNDATLEK